MSVKEKSQSQFTSPLHRHVQAREETVDELKERLEKLNKEIQTLQAEGLQESELKIHIEKLHEYNMLKDVGQAVLGQLASLRCVSTQDVYKDYGLDLED